MVTNLWYSICILNLYPIPILSLLLKYTYQYRYPSMDSLVLKTQNKFNIAYFKLIPIGTSYCNYISAILSFIK